MGDFYKKKIQKILSIKLLRIFSHVRSAGSCSFNPGTEHSGSLQIYSDDQCTTTLSLTPEHHHHSEVRTTQGHSYIGPQTLSRTFLIIPDNLRTLYRRPFLDRSRQHENSREAARHFRNVTNCAVYRTTRLLNDAILTHYAQFHEMQGRRKTSFVTLPPS